MTSEKRPVRTLGLSRTADGRTVPSLRRRSVAAIRGSDELMSWLATAAVTMLALFLRLWDLGKPRAFLFDETYYAKDAWSLVHNGLRHSATSLTPTTRSCPARPGPASGPRTRAWWSTPRSGSG